MAKSVTSDRRGWQGALAELNATQRAVFAVESTGGLPPEALTTGLGLSRNAIYQALFEARRKIATRLAADAGHGGGPGAALWPGGLIAADPGDTGCDIAFRGLDRYAEADAGGARPRERYPGIAVHLAGCRPCRQDYEGLLAAIG